MACPLRILLLEDDPADAELIQGVLEADGVVCEITRVEAREEFVRALEKGEIDLILADYSLPSFDGLAALELAQKIRPELPFLFVSGTLGEERAIEALKRGATDFVLKNSTVARVARGAAGAAGSRRTRGTHEGRGSAAPERDVFGGGAATEPDR